MQSHSAEAPRGAAPPVIRLDGVGKTFRMPDGSVFEAVRAVSLDVAQGDIVGLIGKSGAGKSTLLRLINLLERPDTGSVHVAGRELTRMSRRDLMGARQSIGMIFQQFNLLQNASVADNVAFPLRIHGRHRGPEIAERVRECLDIVGLADKASSHPAQLSGGQKQRVAIARALAPRPQVLLCDEPTSALDTETTRSVLATLEDINRRFGVSIVIVTHELSVVEALCRRVAIVEGGRIAEEFEVRAATGAERLTLLGRELDRLVRRRAREARIEAEEAAEEERRAAGGPAAPAAAAMPADASRPAAPLNETRHA